MNLIIEVHAVKWSPIDQEFKYEDSFTIKVRTAEDLQSTLDWISQEVKSAGHGYELAFNVFDVEEQF